MTETTQPEPLEGAGVADPTPDEIDFDVHALPGGVRSAIEAVLMVADEPIAAVRLAAVLALPTEEVETELAALAASYQQGERPRGFELRQVAGGWRFYSAGPFTDVVAKFVLDGQTSRLTQAALETLAIVAYRQPVTRGQIAAVRGVNVDGVVRTLVSRGLIIEIGTDQSSGAVLYGTSDYFLERMDLQSLSDLPPLAPYLPDFDAISDVEG